MALISNFDRQVLPWNPTQADNPVFSGLKAFTAVQANSRANQDESLRRRSQELEEALFPLRQQQIQNSLDAFGTQLDTAKANLDQTKLENEAIRLQNKQQTNFGELIHDVFVAPASGAAPTGTEAKPLSNNDLSGHKATIATTFGYKDSEDNGVGSPVLGSVDTSHPDTRGVALPLDELKAQLGDDPEAWKRARVEVVANGKSTTVPIVDIGPGRGPRARGVGIDVTEGTRRDLGLTGRDPVHYKIIPDGGGAADTGANPISQLIAEKQPSSDPLAEMGITTLTPVSGAENVVGAPERKPLAKELAPLLSNPLDAIVADKQAAARTYAESMTRVTKDPRYATLPADKQQQILGALQQKYEASNISIGARKEALDEARFQSLGGNYKNISRQIMAAGVDPDAALRHAEELQASDLVIQKLRADGTFDTAVAAGKAIGKPILKEDLSGYWKVDPQNLAQVQGLSQQKLRTKAQLGEEIKAYDQTIADQQKILSDETLQQGAPAVYTQAQVSVLNAQKQKDLALKGIPMAERDKIVFQEGIQDGMAALDQQQQYAQAGLDWQGQPLSKKSWTPAQQIPALIRAHNIPVVDGNLPPDEAVKQLAALNLPPGTPYLSRMGDNKGFTRGVWEGEDKAKALVGKASAATAAAKAAEPPAPTSGFAGAVNREEEAKKKKQADKVAEQTKAVEDARAAKIAEIKKDLATIAYVESREGTPMHFWGGDDKIVDLNKSTTITWLLQKDPNLSIRALEGGSSETHRILTEGYAKKILARRQELEKQLAELEPKTAAAK